MYVLAVVSYIKAVITENSYSLCHYSPNMRASSGIIHKKHNYLCTELAN